MLLRFIEWSQVAAVPSDAPTLITPQSLRRGQNSILDAWSVFSDRRHPSLYRVGLMPKGPAVMPLNQ